MVLAVAATVPFSAAGVVAGRRSSAVLASAGLHWTTNSLGYCSECSRGMLEPG
jgi:hypothetical protein